MKFGATILCLVSALTTLVESVHVRGFTSYSCVGHQWVCYNLPAGTCCGPFPSPIYSMRWTLPADTRGIGHVNKYCTWPFPAVYGPRTNSCFNYRGKSVRSAKWQQGYCVWQWKRSVILERQDDKCAVAEGCAEPGVLVYFTAEGVQRAVVVPAGTAGNVTAFLDAKDYKSLSTLADFKEELDLKTSVDAYDIAAIAES